MPAAVDEEFTNLLIERISSSAQSFGISGFALEIKEKYEVEDKPHYHFSIDIGLCENPSPLEMFATYSATAGEDTYLGRMDMIFKSGASDDINRIMVVGSFFIYDELIRDFYSEWKTVYETINLP